jgi:ABC-type Fe3+/spermidine/putrescine transport system ATPase subunit
MAAGVKRGDRSTSNPGCAHIHAFREAQGEDMASVRLEGISKVYGGDGGHIAVEDATFAVQDGEFVVLVGPSGCGKSTTLRMIAGLESISAGRLYIGDRLVNNVSPRDRDIAMVFQTYALYPHMSAYSNLAFALKLRGVSREEIDRRVRHAAEILGIEEILNRTPRQLSGGQRQRVALGRAIVRDPQSFCSMSRSPTWTRSCGSRCGPSCRRCIAGWARRWCTSRTTRWRR